MEHKFSRERVYEILLTKGTSEITIDPRSDLATEHKANIFVITDIVDDEIRDNYYSQPTINTYGDITCIAFNPNGKFDIINNNADAANEKIHITISTKDIYQIGAMT